MGSYSVMDVLRILLIMAWYNLVWILGQLYVFETGLRNNIHKWDCLTVFNSFVFPWGTLICWLWCNTGIPVISSPVVQIEYWGVWEFFESVMFLESMTFTTVLYCTCSASGCSLYTVIDVRLLLKKWGMHPVMRCLDHSGLFSFRLFSVLCCLCFFMFVLPWEYEVLLRHKCVCIQCRWWFDEAGCGLEGNVVLIELSEWWVFLYYIQFISISLQQCGNTRR